MRIQVLSSNCSLSTTPIQTKQNPKATFLTLQRILSTTYKRCISPQKRQLSQVILLAMIYGNQKERDKEKSQPEFKSK